MKMLVPAILVVGCWCHAVSGDSLASVVGSSRPAAGLDWQVDRLDTNDTYSNTSKIYCKDVHKHNSSWQCFFVENNTDCAIAGGFVSYLNLPYCHLTGNLQPVAIIILFLWLLYLFLAIGVTVEHFLCPALSVISNTLGLSESVAGVTFLAFGNGAADIFSLFVLITTGDRDAVRAETGMGAIFGGGLFVTTIVVGLIAFNYPLHIKLSTYLRDVFFYTIAIGWLILMLSDGLILKYEAVGFIILYMVYVTTVIIMLKCSQRRATRAFEGLEEESERSPLLASPDQTPGSQRSPPSYQGHGSAGAATQAQQPSVDQDSMSGSFKAGNFTGSIAGGSMDWRLTSDGSLLKSRAEAVGEGGADNSDKNSDAATGSAHTAPSSTGSSARPSTVTSPSRSGHAVADGEPATGVRAAAPALRRVVTERGLEASGHHSYTTAVSGSGNAPPHVPAMHTFARGLWPYSIADVKSLSWLGRIMLVLRVPIRLALTFTTPVILPASGDDGDDEPGAQWNKYLIALNCLVAPMFATLALDVFFHELQGAEVIFVGVISCGVGCLLCLSVLVFTRAHHPPTAKPIFAFLGFLMSVVWIYMIANEVVNILDTMGVVLQLNGAFLGLTILAGGNSVCDLVANFLVAKSGKAEMAVAACYGSPLLNMLIGVGLSATVATFRDDEHYELEFTRQLILASAALLSGLAFATAYIIATHCSCGWKAGRAFAIPLFCGYIAFLGVVIGLEFG